MKSHHIKKNIQTVDTGYKSNRQKNSPNQMGRILFVYWSLREFFFWSCCCCRMAIFFPDLLYLVEIQFSFLFPIYILFSFFFTYRPAVFTVYWYNSSLFCRSYALFCLTVSTIDWVCVCNIARCVRGSV